MSTLNSTPVGIHATSPRAIVSMAQMYAAMDDVSDYAVSFARIDRMTDDQREAASEASEAAYRAACLEDMHHALRRLFLRAMEFAGAASTPKVPVTVRFNAATDDEADRFEYRIRQEPVTVVAHTMIDTHGGTDDHLRLMIASADELVAMRAKQLHVLATEYADGYAQSLLDAGWTA